MIGLTLVAVGVMGAFVGCVPGLQAVVADAPVPDEIVFGTQLELFEGFAFRENMLGLALRAWLLAATQGELLLPVVGPWLLS